MGSDYLTYNHTWNADSFEYVNSSVCSEVVLHLKLWTLPNNKDNALSFTKNYDHKSS